MSTRAYGWLTVCLFLTPVLIHTAAGAPAKNWQAATTGYWTNASNWVELSIPQDGDDVYITNGGNAILSEASSNLNSITISNTLTFTNWITTLTASNVTVLSNGYITCAGPFTNSPAMSNRVYVICTNLTVAAGGSFNVNGKGYAGVASPAATGAQASGPGGARTYSNQLGGGGGYGGMGGSGALNAWTGGTTYGLPDQPTDPGSGGSYYMGGSGGSGGAGGGLIRIEASGAVTLNGTMTANGAIGTVDNHNGGGSGGGIYIQCKTVTGGGPLTATGVGDVNGPGGGGGRLAIIYNSSAQAATNNPTGVMSVAGGVGGYQSGDIGTLYFSDTRFLGTTMNSVRGQWMSANFTNWSANSLLLTNCWLRFPQPGFQLTVTNDVILTGASRLDLGANGYVTSFAYTVTTPPTAGWQYRLCSTSTTNPVFSVGGNVNIATGCTVYLYSALTNGATPDYGLLMSVTGDVSIASNAWIYPISHLTNGGAPLLRMSNLVLAAGGGINADGQGFGGGNAAGLTGWGPGGGRLPSNIVGGGGSYGGMGGGGEPSAWGGAPTYGSADAPMFAGSGGCFYHANGDASGGVGGNGGGLIRIEAGGAVTLAGTITANGTAGLIDGHYGGGSGGGIYVQCKTITGSGPLTAYGGGAASGGGAGGGRIALVYDGVAQAATNNPTGVYSTIGGVGGRQNGDIGTVYFSDTRFIGGTLRHTAQILSSTNIWSVSSLVLTNGSWVRFPQPGLRLNVSGDIVIAGASRLDLGANAYVTNMAYPDQSSATWPYTLLNSSTTASVFSVGGNVNIATGCTAYLYGGLTNAATPDYGLLMSVTGDVSIASNAFIYSVSHYTNGGAPLLRMSNLTVSAGGAISASGSGFASATGPGAGSGTSGGGGYGGSGTGTGFGGTYGSSNAPLRPGSGGGKAASGNYYGGGLVRVEAQNLIRVNGSILAVGNGAVANGTLANTSGNGGASGGGIFLTCQNLTGNNGTLSVQGGNSGGGAGGNGGGGRLAVWYGTIRDADRTKILNGQADTVKGILVSNTLSSFTGAVTIAGGTGGTAGNGADGTAVFLTIVYRTPGTVIGIR